MNTSESHHESVLVVEEVSQDSIDDHPKASIKSLHEWREYFKANGNVLLGPDDVPHEIDLATWEDAPGDTLISVYAWWRNPALIGTKDPLGRPW